MAWTWSQLQAEVPDLADHEVRRLLLSAAGREAAWLIGDPEVPHEAITRFRDAVRRRRSGEPLQYIEGTVQFGPLQLHIDERALIPRPETERLWELLSGGLVGAPQVIVDLCTGSGNLALALKHRFSEAAVFGVDISPAAIALARENAEATGLIVEFLEGDLFEALPGSVQGRVDLLVSNPPYVATAEMDLLPAEIRDHEPAGALDAGSTGLESLERIARGARRWLRPGGTIACEIGETQGEACLRAFSGYSPQIERDLAGKPRYVLGRAPESANVH